MLGAIAMATPAPTDGGDDPSVVPIGIPLIGGPGAMTTVMVLVGQAETSAHLGMFAAALLATTAAAAAAALPHRRSQRASRLPSGGVSGGAGRAPGRSVEARAAVTPAAAPFEGRRGAQLCL